MPAFAWNRLVSARGISAVPYEQYRPNARRGTHVRANVQANLTPKIDLAVQTGFITKITITDTFGEIHTVYQATAQALSNSAHNATTAQQQNSITAQAATTMGVATLYSLDTASTGEATRAILSTKVKGL